MLIKGEIYAWKVPTTPEDPSRGIIQGLENSATQFDFTMSDIELIVHGTTIGTNAFLEDKCPPIGFITTRGFKDIIEIGRQQRSELYNLKFQERYPISFKSDFLFEVDERINKNGDIIKKLDVQFIDNVLPVAKAKDISTIAISLLFSFLNPVHERNIQIILDDYDLDAFISYDICPQIKEYERAVTTIINAKVSPVIGSYLSDLKSKLIKKNILSPLLIMQSNTGMSDVKTISRMGIQTLFSGLAGGVLAASQSLRHLNRQNLVSLDIGGTSTDVSALINQPIILGSRSFSGFPIIASLVDVETIGSGGGSIAKYKDGLLTVGPESQGANPGPACYSLGGEEVTLTDANLYLGYVHSDNFAGNLKIDINKSIHQLQGLLADIKSSSYDLNIETIGDLALAIRKILNNNIANAIRVVTIQRGLDPRDFSLLAFGGAGPMQAWEIGKELEMEGVIIPPLPGVWSAYGLISSNIKHKKTLSYLKIIEDIILSDINDTFLQLKSKLEETLFNEGIKDKQQIFNFSVDVRYLGQADVLNLNIQFPLTKKELNLIEKKFHELHNQNYSWMDTSLQIEIVNISVEGVGLVSKIQVKKLEEGTSIPPSNALKGSRTVNFNGILQETPIYHKTELKANNKLEGPCIVDQLDTTIIIPPDAEGTVNQFGYIVMQVKK